MSHSSISSSLWEELFDIYELCSPYRFRQCDCKSLGELKRSLDVWGSRGCDLRDVPLTNGLVGYLDYVWEVLCSDSKLLVYWSPTWSNRVQVCLDLRTQGLFYITTLGVSGGEAGSVTFRVLLRPNLSVVQGGVQIHGIKERFPHQWVCQTK